MPYWRQRRPKVPPAIPSALHASWLLAYTRAALSIHSLGIFCISSSPKCCVFDCCFSALQIPCRPKKTGCVSLNPIFQRPAAGKKKP